MRIPLVAKKFHPSWAAGSTAFARGLLQSILATGDAEATLLSTARPHSYLRDVVSEDVLRSYEDGSETSYSTGSSIDSSQVLVNMF